MQGGNSLHPLLSISVAIPNYHKLQPLNLNHYYRHGQSRHEENITYEPNCGWTWNYLCMTNYDSVLKDMQCIAIE